MLGFSYSFGLYNKYKIRSRIERRITVKNIKVIRICLDFDSILWIMDYRGFNNDIKVFLLFEVFDI